MCVDVCPCEGGVGVDVSSSVCVDVCPCEGGVGVDVSVQVSAVRRVVVLGYPPRPPRTELMMLVMWVAMWVPV